LNLAYKVMMMMISAVKHTNSACSLYYKLNESDWINIDAFE